LHLDQLSLKISTSILYSYSSDSEKTSKLYLRMTSILGIHKYSWLSIV